MSAGPGERAASRPRALLPPTLQVAAVWGYAATDESVDLAPAISDPPAVGCTVTVLPGIAAGLTATIEGTVLHFRAERPGDYVLPLRLESRHPLRPHTTPTLTIRLAAPGKRFANGFRYRRTVTRPSVSGVPPGPLIRFPVPVRITGEAWARRLGDGGRLECDPAIDLAIEDERGEPLPFELRPDHDLAAGNLVLVVSVDIDPAIAQRFFIYYGARRERTPEQPGLVYVDYHDVYTGGGATRNPAASARPWTLASAAVILPAPEHPPGQDRLDLVLVTRRGAPEPTVRIGEGEAAGLDVRVAPPELALATTGGRARWRAATTPAASERRCLAFSWLSGTRIQAHLDGVPLPAAGSEPVVAGVTQVAGPLVLGGPIEELRLGKLDRPPAWRILEHRSLTDPAFTTIGPEEEADAAADALVVVEDRVEVDYREGGSAVIDVLANDLATVPGRTLSLKSVAVTRGGGSARIDGRRVRYTYPAGFSGSAEGTYEVSDGTQRALGAWHVTVRAPPPWPEARRFGGVLTGWPHSADAVGMHQLGSGGPGHWVAHRFRNPWPGVLTHLGWEHRLTDPGEPGTASERYSAGSGGTYRIILLAAAGAGAPATAQPDLAAEVGRTALNGGWPGPLEKGNARDGRCRANDPAQRAAWDGETESGRPGAQFEWWPLETPTRPLAAGEILFALWRNLDPEPGRNFVSNVNPHTLPRNNELDPLSYDKNGPWLGPWATSLETRDGGRSWSARGSGMVVRGFALRYGDGLRWGYPGGAPATEEDHALSPERRLRMDWVQPETLTHRWFAARLFGRSAELARLRLVVRRDDAAAPLLDVELDAAAVATSRPVAGGTAVPWCYWDLGTELVLGKGKRHRAELWCREGSCLARPCEQSGLTQRDGALGSARYSADGGATWAEVAADRRAAWPICWLERSHSPTRLPWQPVAPVPQAADETAAFGGLLAGPACFGDKTGNWAVREGDTVAYSFVAPRTGRIRRFHLNLRRRRDRTQDVYSTRAGGEYFWSIRADENGRPGAQLGAESPRNGGWAAPLCVAEPGSSPGAGGDGVANRESAGLRAWYQFTSGALPAVVAGQRYWWVMRNAAAPGTGYSSTNNLYWSVEVPPDHPLFGGPYQRSGGIGMKRGRDGSWSVARDVLGHTRRGPESFLLEYEDGVVCGLWPFTRPHDNQFMEIAGSCQIRWLFTAPAPFTCDGIWVRWYAMAPGHAGITASIEPQDGAQAAVTVRIPATAIVVNPDGGSYRRNRGPPPVPTFHPLDGGGRYRLEAGRRYAVRFRTEGEVGLRTMASERVPFDPAHREAAWMVGTMERSPDGGRSWSRTWPGGCPSSPAQAMPQLAFRRAR